MKEHVASDTDTTSVAVFTQALYHERASGTTCTRVDAVLIRYPSSIPPVAMQSPIFSLGNLVVQVAWLFLSFETLTCIIISARL